MTGEICDIAAVSMRISTSCVHKIRSWFLSRACTISSNLSGKWFVLESLAAQFSKSFLAVFIELLSGGDGACMDDGVQLPKEAIAENT